MWARGVAVIVLAGLAAGCAAAGPSIGELPVGSPPTLEAEGSDTGATVLLVPGPVGPVEDQLYAPAPIVLPTDPLAFFRAQYVECSQYANLAGRGDDGYPQVEEDRFTEAVLVRELDADTALIEDGRGTRLVVDQWRAMGTVLPESGRPDDVMPAPYRLGCSPDRFVGLPG